MAGTVISLSSRRPSLRQPLRNDHSNAEELDQHELLIDLEENLANALALIDGIASVPAADRELLVALTSAYAEPLECLPGIIKDFISEHGPGLNATVSSLVHEPDGADHLRPEILLVLERLEGDPFALQCAWPPERSLDGLRLVADAFARPI